ncbi:exopolysaccharide biosynthesis protein [Rhodovulum sp. YNF3179]|uniref:exopolysaccharide biosynthesis protein n=1 Tax=Rhodovulum sp. YNF3179 TaxID=3425127 RepID=UPI003D3341D1
MNQDPDTPRRASLSLPILRTSRALEEAGTLTLGNLLAALGERSFGWALLVFSLITLLPLPPGSSLVTALPVMVATAQMALGFPYVRLPWVLARIRIDHAKLRRTLLRLRPVTRRLERILRPRSRHIFSARYERALGVALFAIAFTLFLPVPGSGWFPAVALFIFGVGLIERDGLVAAFGLVFGAGAMALTLFIILSLASGAETLLQ